jgi:hypothetical protein
MTHMVNENPILNWVQSWNFLEVDVLQIAEISDRSIYSKSEWITLRDSLMEWKVSVEHKQAECEKAVWQNEHTSLLMPGYSAKS